MTISNQTNLATFNGDGVSTLFPFPVYFLLNLHIKVTLILVSSGLRTLLTEGVDYTLIGAGNQLGGQVTMTVAPSSLYQLEIKRTVTLTQGDNYVVGGDLPAETIEKDFDYAMMVAQQLDQRLSVIESSGVGLGINIVNLAGSGVGMFASQVGNVYNFKKIVGFGGVTITDAGTEVDISITGALQAANNLSDVAAQQTALDTLTNVAAATNEWVLTKNTADGHAVFKPATAGLIPPGNTYQALRADGTWAAELKDAGASGFLGLGSALVISDTAFAPGLWINQKGANADSRLWRMTAANSGGNSQFGLFACTDAGGPSSVFTVARAAGVPTIMTLMPSAGRVVAFAITDDGVTSLQVGGSMRFDGASRVLSADTVNATLANRFAFQDSTLNAETDFNIVPNGTSVIAQVGVHGAASLTNAAFGRLRILSTDVRLDSGHNGGGTTLPLILSIDGNAKFRVNTAGRVLINEPTDDTTSALQLAGSMNFFSTGARIRGDFSNATLSSRLAFQTNVAGGNTSITMIPNGASHTANFRCYNNSDLTQPLAYGHFQCDGTNGVAIDSNVLNGGTQQPIVLSIATVTKVSIDINGNTSFFGATADKSNSTQVPLTGFAITIPNNCGSLTLNPAGLLATGTITMPATPIDQQRVEIASTQTVTTLTVSPNAGQTISGAPTTITAATPFGFRYVLSLTKWVRAE